MQWLNSLGQFVMAFIGALAGLALFVKVVIPVGEGVWTQFSKDSMTLIAFSVVALAAAGVARLTSGNGGSGS